MNWPVEWKNIKRVTVFGMGKSGVSSVKVLVQLGIETHAVNEGKVENWIGQHGLAGFIGPSFCHEQENSEDVFAQSDLIILSPGIPKTHEVLQKAVTQGIAIFSEIELAYRLTSHIPVIAITGSNGKTTTTTMIAESLKLAGKKVFCGGNIGLPYTELALIHETFDYAVIEVSSFQLETIETFHPQVALILNLSLNHTERYNVMEDYAKAKFALLSNMQPQDHLILGEETPYITEWVKELKIQTHYFSKEALPIDWRHKFDWSKCVLKGGHNQANFYCAYKTLSLLNISNLDALFQSFLETFKGVEHRLEYVGESGGLKIYNDAKSTNIEATRTALKAFEEGEGVHLILGGKLRSEADTVLMELIPFRPVIRTIFTMGATSERLYHELHKHFHVEQKRDLDDVLKSVKENKLQGNLVFSPAHPSFDQFKNYVHRGETFKQKVQDLFFK